ncbi:MAG: AEC family transporter [Oscillospiraceae bacterium]|nr:AEC family transporter [Oscillospiraceae bacterium]
MQIGIVFEQTLKLFLMIIVGYILARIELLDQHTKQKLTKILLSVTTPFMMIDAFSDRMKTLENEGSGSVSVGMLFLFSFLFYLALIVLSFILVYAMRTPKADRRIYLFMTIFGNVGFMGFPVVQAVYGGEGLFYAAILNSMFNIFVYTYGVVLMGGASESGGSFASQFRSIPWKKLLLTPAVIGTAVGVLIFALRIHMPKVIESTCDTLGGLTSPLAMLLVGANLNGIQWKELFMNARLSVYVILRQIALPLLIWLFIKAVVKDPVLAPTLLLLACMPIANTTSLFATEYHGNEKLASKGIFLSTLFSLLSFPLIIWICV